MSGDEFNLSFFISREERHYCAHLFKWLLDSPTHIEAFLPHTLALGEGYRLFYEYTAVREYLYTLKRNDLKAYEQLRALLNIQLVDFENHESDFTNDIQKKKIDLAIQAQINGKTMVYLVEAKFEEGFDLKQLTLTENYGKILNALFGFDYKLLLLGMAYHLNKPSLAKYPQVSWEDLVRKIDDPIVKNEIAKGLEYQYEIHPRTKPKL